MSILAPLDVFYALAYVVVIYAAVFAIAWNLAAWVTAADRLWVVLPRTERDEERMPLPKMQVVQVNRK